MIAMNRQSIGVWFSVALVLFLISLWLGYVAGVHIAQVRNQAQLQRVGPVSSVSSNEAGATLFALSTLRTLRLAGAHDRGVTKGSLDSEIDGLKGLRARPGTEAIRPIIDLHFAIASIGMSALEQQAGNIAKAQEHLESAKELLGSLGWKDRSETTLKAVQEKEMNRWNVKVSDEDH